ncbi:FecCD family ABC transporter permease [Ligilactobacillus acidipiscis]|uniref:FecCD family ABC transporter permease n=1 Tax=Ligilactobacillus acidipiscis TaxID=89059 RepID=UPI0023F8A444|nr:iron ABC transporter permease [Ligilactobacillus acidipiscis]WEV56919.1 iron ABC transporter permease [Ligilactobacillus acidipiscis]
MKAVDHVKSHNRVKWKLVSSLFVLLIFAGLASVFCGVKDISVHDVSSILLMQKVSDSLVGSIVQKRIIRTFFAILCGAALGISGALMQGVTRNPLADPSILGINTGASFFVVCGLAFFKISSAWQYIGLAFIGALAAAAIVFGIIFLEHKVDPLTLILSGTAVSIMFSSLVTTVILVKQDSLDQFRFWQVGSLGSATSQGTMLFIPIFIAGFILAMCCAPGLNALMLGDELARNLGVNAVIINVCACIAGIILCATATALAGPIAFIGLLSTHATKLIVGSDLRKVIPLSSLTGALFLTIADVIGRLVSDSNEISVGIITALVGAPLLIYLARRTKVQAQ